MDLTRVFCYTFMYYVLLLALLSLSLHCQIKLYHIFYCYYYFSSYLVVLVIRLLKLFSYSSDFSHLVILVFGYFSGFIYLIILVFLLF